MDLEALRNKVKEYATEAVKYDKLEKYEIAYELYMKAANELQVIIKYDQNPFSKKIYIERAKEYASRAKEIKEKKLDKDNNEFYESQIKELRRQLNEERYKNQILILKNNELNNIINNLKDDINTYQNKIKCLENEIKNYKSNYNCFDNKTNSDMIVLRPGEKIMTINFVSMGNQDIGHFSLPCKNKDIFVRLEEKLNDEFPKLKDSETYFEVNGRRIKRFKTLDENKIKSNDIINIFLIDE